MNNETFIEQYKLNFITDYVMTRVRNDRDRVENVSELVKEAIAAWELIVA